MSKILHVKGYGIVVRGNDIDTDQIIPARFLKAITFTGIEKYAFYDLRYNEDGSKKEHPFNDEKYAKSNIMIVNNNFGCGSSREHAPQTLQRHGIDAIIGESFAEIFAGNCTALGVPILILSRKEIHEIQDMIENDPSIPIEISIDKAQITIGKTVYTSSIKKEIQTTFLQGTWDNTTLMLSFNEKIEETYNRLPYIQHFKGYK